MIVTKEMNDRWLSNTYVVADKPGGHAVLIDTGAPAGPILKQIEDLRVTVTHVLCTHHHYDHVAENATYRAKFGCPICGGAKESDLFDDLEQELRDGDEIVSGDLHIRSLEIPGHTIGQLAFLVNDTEVFTGDTLFHNSIGGTRAPGHTTYEDIKHSIMDILLRLPRDMVVRPGHTDPTTVAQEMEHNPFVRIWRGLDPPGEKRCIAMGQPATLILRAADYDGGTKCWVRFDEGNMDDIVPGSMVQGA